jgi:hypothetical protein
MYRLFNSLSSYFVGTTTPFTPLTPFTPHDLRKIGEGKAVVLRKRLESASDSITGQTCVDVNGYLTSLSNIKTSTAAEIDDKKKAELLMANITATNPKHAPGWIARARLEARAGQYQFPPFSYSLSLFLFLSFFHSFFFSLSLSLFLSFFLSLFLFLSFTLSFSFSLSLFLSFFLSFFLSLFLFLSFFLSFSLSLNTLSFVYICFVS